MATEQALERGRASFGRHAWRDAYAQLSLADGQAPLDVADVERLAMAAYLSGNDSASSDLWIRAHHEYRSRSDAAKAVRCAYWLSFVLFNGGEMAPAMAWLARAQRLLDDDQSDCVERGYVLLPVAIQLVEEDAEAASATFKLALEIGERFQDLDLIAIARAGYGRALLRLGAIAEGVALLDEAMVAITAGELSPIVVGDVYCTVIEGCVEVFDVRRAREWTAALSHWCASQPDLVPYRGQCMVHRTEIMQIHGAWDDALGEARSACERLSDHPAVGAALYRLGELHRLRGEFPMAEDAYRRASQQGTTPQPGLALLRLTQGQADAAESGIRRVLSEERDRAARSRLLAACVEIMLEVQRVEEARTSADELSGIAAGLDAPFLRAIAAIGQGAVLLAEGEPTAALHALRSAWTASRAIEAPYEAARVRVLIGMACRDLGDDDSAQMEFDAACWVFQQLGAAPDLARVERLSRTTAIGTRCVLSARELDVIRLVAAGKTNRAIASDLFLSEKTVARHVSNIFAKLGLASRAAATAYAYEHDLL